MYVMYAMHVVHVTSTCVQVVYRWLKKKHISKQIMTLSSVVGLVEIR